MDKHLTDLQFTRLELVQKEQMNKKLEKMLLEKDTAILKQKQEILKLQISLLDGENFKKQQAIQEKQKQIDRSKEKAIKLHGEIESEYDLKPGWGYDPDSLKLIEKE